MEVVNGNSSPDHRAWQEQSFTSRPLTPKQQRFVDAYVVSLNAADAARQAGYKGNSDTLKQVGCENLAKPYIAAAIGKRTARAAQKAEKRIVNVYEEFTKNLEFVGKLRDASERWLVDPGDEQRFSIDPRADEIDCVYFDYEDKDAQGNPKRKTECLQELLARLNGTRYESDTQFVKTADIREFALKACDRIDTTLDKFAKMGGNYTAPKDNPDTVASALETFSQWLEFNPEATQEERSRAIKDFAALGKVDEKVLRSRVQDCDLSSKLVN